MSPAEKTGTSPTTSPLPGVESTTASAGFWREAWRRFRRQRLSLAAFVLLGVLALLAVFAPLVAGTKPIVCGYKGETYYPIAAYWGGSENGIFLRDRFRGVYPVPLKKKDPASWAIWPLLYKDAYRRVESGEWEGDPGDRALAPPSWRNFCGTDEHGRDVLARVLYGTRIALLVGLVSMGIAGTLGIIIGALAGYLGGKVDMVISRLIDVLLCVPTLVLILAMLSIIERPSIFHLMAVIGLTRWESIARLTRGEVMRIKSCDYVLAARALGASWSRILFRHILPNALAPAFVTIAFGIANAVLLESALSFLGFGSSPDTPSWGRTLDSWRANKECWWLAVFPGLAIFLTVLAYNLVGDGFQEATDPRLRD